MVDMPRLWVAARLEKSIYSPHSTLWLIPVWVPLLLENSLLPQCRYQIQPCRAFSPLVAKLLTILDINLLDLNYTICWLSSQVGVFGCFWAEFVEHCFMLAISEYWLKTELRGGCSLTRGSNWVTSYVSLGHGILVICINLFLLLVIVELEICICKTKGRISRIGEGLNSILLQPRGV